LAVGVMTTVYLRSAAGQQLDRFEQEMRARGWSRFAQLRFTFWQHFPEQEPSVEVVAATISQVENAANEAGVSDWNAVCLQSRESPMAF